MKEHILVKTKNIGLFNQAIDYALTRQIAHQSGIIVVYGNPGLGKTQCTMREAINNRWVWYSARKADTPKGFIQQLTHQLLMRYYPQQTPYISGSKSTLFNRCVDIINENTTSEHMPVILIDEVDNIIHEAHEGIIGMLRDIADNTAAVVGLVGMQELRVKLMKLNAHYYKRVAYFCEFKQLDRSDVSLLCRELSDVTIAADKVNDITQQSKGDARDVIKSIRSCEEIAHAYTLREIDLATFNKLVRDKAVYDISSRKSSIPVYPKVSREVQ